MYHLVIALLDLAEVLGALGIVLGLYGLVLVAGRLADEVNQVGDDMLDLFEIGRSQSRK